MKGIFIGKDGSMGFKHGKEYQFYTWCERNYLFLKTSNGLWCPYGSMEKMLENWRILNDNRTDQRKGGK